MFDSEFSLGTKHTGRMGEQMPREAGAGSCSGTVVMVGPVTGICGDAL